MSRATIDAIDTETAAEHHDVVRVITDFRGVTLPYDISRVSFFGQPLAIVIANTLQAATHGAALVAVRYHAEPQHTDFDDPAVARDPSKSGPDYSRGRCRAAHRTRRRGPHVHDRPQLPQPHGDPGHDRRLGRRPAHGMGQGPGHPLQPEAYSDALGIPAANIRVISPFVGGAFGSAGETWPHQFLAAHAARQLRRPVKLSLTRPQMYAAIGYRPVSWQRVALAADRTGAFTATVHESEVEVSRYGSYEDSPTEGTKLLYSSPAFRSAVRIVPLDTSEPTYMRGPGAVTGAFALECAIDELAERLQMDPIELRLRNEPSGDQSTGTPFSTRRLTDCFRQGAEAFGWSRRNPTPGATREGDLLIGMGTAAALYHTVRSESSASARLNADGTAEILTAASDIGPGTYTSMSQVAADALGLPMSKIRFSLGDSRYPKAATQYGSQVMLSVGSSVALTANMLRDRAVRTAVIDPGSPLNGLRPDDVTITDGSMHLSTDPRRGETYQDLLRRRGLQTLDANQTYSPDDANTRYSMHSYGAVFAEVAVDELLATLRIRRIYAVYDAGRIINPKLAHSQALGGMTQGIGMALLESAETDYRDGRIVNANLSDTSSPSTPTSPPSTPPTSTPETTSPIPSE